VKPIARRSPFEHQPSTVKIVWMPIGAVMLASMLPIMPVIATAPLMPPLGFMMFISWRLLHREIWHPWAGAALGLYDDFWSGHHIGTAMLLWSVAQFGVALMDRRMLWRDYWQDWMLAAFGLVGYLSLALLIDNKLGGQTLWIMIVPQVLVAILLQPYVIRMTGYIDVWRFR